MPISYTSRLSFCSLVEQLKGRRQQVYQVIRDWDPALKGEGPTIEDIAAELRMQQSAVSGRVTELKELGAIQPAGMKINQSGKAAHKYTAWQYKEEAYEAKTDPTGQTRFL